MKLRNSIAFILVVVILLILAVLPILYERQEQQRRAEMYVTLEDDTNLK